MKILIKNGLIVDGTNTAPYEGSVLIQGERIAKVGVFEDVEADRVIDAKGRAVTPGFIDTHSHSDLKILENPYNEIKIRQGITTEVLGQDGVSMAPLPKEYISPWRKNIAGLDGESDIIDWEYETTENYLRMMEENKVGLNESYLVPHGNIRMEAMGLDSRFATEEEIEKMCEITRREMEAGAYGLSTGLIYIPCAYAETKELVEMCKVVAEFDGCFVIHQRSEADDILNSMKEVIEIGEQSGVKVHFSHFKVCGKNNWQYIPGMLELIKEAKERGIRVSFDQYPYAAGSTMLGVVLPPWAHAGGTDKLMERLADPAEREKMTESIQEGIPGWDNFIDFAGFDQIFVTSVKTLKNEDAVGKSLEELAEMRNTDPYNATYDLLLEEENAVGMVDHYGLEEHVITFLTQPEQNVCTDGLLGGRPHPRAYGSFPRVLGRYVRDQKILSLESAIYKMTKKSAEAIGIPDRGVLEEGKFADICIIDMDTVTDVGDYVDPIHFPLGIDYVIVNGTPVIEEGEYLKLAAGKVLRRS